MIQAADGKRTGSGVHALRACEIYGHGDGDGDGDDDVFRNDQNDRSNDDCVD